METQFYTLQEFYTHTKAVLYGLIIVSLIGTAVLWRFLTGKDNDENKR